MDVNLTTNLVHVNTSRSKGLNVTANVTIFGLSLPLSLLQLQVAYDDVSFERDYLEKLINVAKDNKKSLVSSACYNYYSLKFLILDSLFP